MNKDIQISGYQLAMIIMGFVFGSSAIISPAASAGRDAWLAYLMGWGGGFLLIWLYVNISLSHPALTLVEILKKSFGKYLGTLFALLYIWYFIHLASLVLRNFGEHMTTTVYYSTPIVFTIGSFALLVAYSLKKGLETTGRAAEMLIPYLFLILMLIFLTLIPGYDAKNFFPILENGIIPVAVSSYGVVTFPFGETVAFLMVFPTMYSSKQLKKVVFLSVLVIGFVLLSIIVRDLMNLGVDMMQRAVFPASLSTELTRGIQLDPLIAVNLLIGGWLKITVCLYAAVVGITQLLKLDDYKPLVFPVTIFSVVLSLWNYKDIFEMLDWAERYYPLYATPMQIFIPVLILIVAKFKKHLKNG